MTIRDRIVEQILAAGRREIRGKSRKYRVFEAPGGGFLYVGRCGALRAGRSLADSLSWPARFAGQLARGEG